MSVKQIPSGCLLSPEALKSDYQRVMEIVERITIENKAMKAALESIRSLTVPYPGNCESEEDFIFQTGVYAGTIHKIISGVIGERK